MNNLILFLVQCTEFVCAYAAAFLRVELSVRERHFVSSFQKHWNIYVFVGFGVFVALYENSVFN